MSVGEPPSSQQGAAVKKAASLVRSAGIVADMINDQQAISLKLTDPRFLLKLVQQSHRVNLVLAAALFAWIGVSLWQWTHPPQPIIIGTDGSGQPRQIQPLSRPVMSDNAVSRWAVQTVAAAFNIDWRDYRSKLTAASQNFTVAGWDSFGASLVTTGDIDKMKQAKLVGWAEPTGGTTMIHEGLVGDRYTYELTFPLRVTFENERQEIEQTLVMHVIVERASEDDHPSGLAIAQVNAVPQ